MLGGAGKAVPREMSRSSAPKRAKGFMLDPGFRRPWIARSNCMKSNGRPEAMTFTAPVRLSTVTIEPVGAQECSVA